MSLEEVEANTKFITFSLRTTDNYLVDMQYPYEKLYFLKDKCGICNVLTQNTYEQTDKFDLSAFRYDSFMIILRYLETGKMPVLGSYLDPNDLYKLALYLGLDNNILYNLNFNSEDRFFSSLTDFDKKIVEDEFNLRQMLYKNEEKDYTNLDKNYEINKVISELKLPELSYTNNGNIHQIQKLNNYYGITVSKYMSGILRIALRNAMIDKEKISTKLVPKLKYPYALNPNKNDIIDYIISQLLNNFTYENYVVAGGFIYRDHVYSETTDNATDLDLFITTKDYNKALKAIQNINDIVVSVNKAIPHQTRKVLISINKNALNFLIVVPLNNIVTYSINIQVVLRLYNSIAQVISGFDIDSCCIAYNGEFYAMPRFVRSQILSYNLVDPERQSTTYAQRLAKYAKRAVNIAMPGLNPDYINCNFMDKPSKYTGLAKIITYCNTYSFAISYSENQFSDYEFSPYLLNLEGVYKTLRSATLSDYYNKNIKGKENKVDEKYEELKSYHFITEGVNDEGYMNMFINGPNKNIFEYLINNNITLPIKISYNLAFILDSGKNKSISDIKVGGIKNVLTILHSSLPSKLEFKTKNSGTQLTNSFNPTTEDWYKDLYFK